MSLWHGYCFGRLDKVKDPILTEMPFMKFDPDQEPEVRVESVSGAYEGYRKNMIHSANGICGLIQFSPGETLFWFFPNEELHYIVKGKAEVTYSLAGTSHTEQKTMTVEPGNCYIVPRGARVTWKVAPGDPLRHLDFIMPGTPTFTERNPDKVVELKK
ncbi:cupin domain-containing protein [Chloroflexota bacterium]